MKRYLFVALAGALLGVTIWAQDKPKAGAANPLALTAEEKSDRDARQRLNQKEVESWNLRVQLLLTQNNMYEEQKKIQDEATTIDDRYYTAHGLDKKEWALQPDGTFVKIPPPPTVAVKPDAAKK